MSLETRISKVEARSEPRGKYPYKLGVQIITDENEAAQSRRKHGIHPDQAVWVTYGDEE